MKCNHKLYITCYSENRVYLACKGCKCTWYIEASSFENRLVLPLLQPLLVPLFVEKPKFDPITADFNAKMNKSIFDYHNNSTIHSTINSSIT